jgi:ribosomal protein S18 acetylase RimI-like enzyme
MTLQDYDAYIALLRQLPFVTVRDADSREATERYLVRNPGLSFVATDSHAIVGCALCGHDGRRGYLQHVAVAPSYRNAGIASELVQRCLEGLARLGIEKVHIDVLKSNDSGLRYWQNRGWTLRDDIQRLSLTPGGNPHA